ncbi:MAG: hypothetical protein GWP91_05180 [Rhodobacterales bacterium]|nr:hypothetical protein [Rhodobacterales bacterium]
MLRHTTLVILIATLGGCSNEWDMKAFNAPAEVPGDEDPIQDDGTIPGTDAPGDGVDDVDPPAEDDCDHTSDLVYVIDRADEALYLFDPVDQSFDLVGELDCTMWGTPGSMAVSRDGYAYIRYSDDAIYAVDLATMNCAETGFAAGLGSFGMGYATDQAGTWRDELYIANSSSLATLDTSSWGSSMLGNMSSQSELTGNANGELWAFLPLERPAELVQLDKNTGAELTTRRLSGFPDASNIDTFAFATWGGEFWLFVRSYGMGNSTELYRVDVSGGLTLVTPDTGMDIVGAGVSTCAPTE